MKKSIIKNQTIYAHTSNVRKFFFFFSFFFSREEKRVIGRIYREDATH